MKYMKAASAIAVSMMAAGAASPAVAADNTSMSLNSGVQQVTDALNTQQPVDSTVKPLLHTTSETAQGVNEAREGKPARLVGTAVTTADMAAPKLGGMPIGG